MGGGESERDRRKRGRHGERERERERERGICRTPSGRKIPNAQQPEALTVVQIETKTKF